ncbi:MAG: hypothetical protein V3T88_08770 [Nitrosomonadaceae bacterium]
MDNTDKLPHSAYVEAARDDIARGIDTRSAFGSLQGLMQQQFFNEGMSYIIQNTPYQHPPHDFGECILND